MLVPRETQRERERASRRRRADNIATMKQRVASLEALAAAVPWIDATDAAWDEFLDADTRRARDFLRRAMMLSEEAVRLKRERGELLRLLREREFAACVVQELLVEMNLAGDWRHNMTQWESLAHSHFSPWQLSECLREVQVALREREAFDQGGAAATTASRSSDSHSLGWLDVRRLDAFGLRVASRKSHHWSNIGAIVDRAWGMYHDGELYKTCMLGPTVDNHHVVLQRVSSDISIIQTIERYPGLEHVFHLIAMVFRVQTASGVLIGVRAIPSPELVDVMQRHGLVAVKNRLWFSWDYDTSIEIGLVVPCVTELNGYIEADHRQYAQRWLAEGLISIVRAEAKLIDNQPHILPQ